MVCENWCHCSVTSQKYLPTFFFVFLQTMYSSGLWQRPEKRKKINSAPLLIKSAWNLWQNAMREKAAIDFGFISRRWSLAHRRTVIQRSTGESETEEPNGLVKETNVLLLTTFTHRQQLVSSTVLFICYIILPSPLIWQVIGLWGVIQWEHTAF